MSVVWEQMGVIRWPLAFSLLAVLVLSCWSGAKLFRSSARADLRTKAWLDAILFWGGFAVVTGVLGTLIGVIIASQAIEAAGAVSAPLMWGGIKVAMLSSAFGLLILAFASLIWFLLQMRWRLLLADAQEAT